MLKKLKKLAHKTKRIFSLADRFDNLEKNLLEMNNSIANQFKALDVDHTDKLNDIIRFHIANQANPYQVKLITQHPIAFYSDDHNFPRGSKNDNTRHPRFVTKCAKIFNKKLKHLDLGCAGGGLVLDFLMNGHFSVGIEGSDYSLVNQRAEWITIPNNLFTADVTMPYHFVDHDNKIVTDFDVITAWELLEHIPEERLDGFFANIKNSLAENGGLFVASIATFEDFDPITGTRWHVTIKPKEWWHDRLQKAGFTVLDNIFEPYDFARGAGNMRLRGFDWDAQQSPDLGFHVTCRINLLT